MNNEQLITNNYPSPSRVDIQPNGWNIGCFWLAEGEDLESELEGAELSVNQGDTLIHTEVLFDQEIVLVVGKNGREILSYLDGFNDAYPYFFFNLASKLPFVPDNYTNDIVGWEAKKTVDRNSLKMSNLNLEDPNF